MNKQAFVDGFIKQAQNNGFSLEESVLILRKQAESPYAGEQAAQVRALDELIAASRYNREENPGHYYANPFVGGPLTEGSRRLRRRAHATQSDEPVQSNALYGGLLNTIMGDKGRKDKAREFSPDGMEEILKQVSSE